MTENKKSNCSTPNCYSVIALCVSFLALGLILGNWAGTCSKIQKCKKNKKSQKYSVDGKAGSTCTWSNTEKKSTKECKKDSLGE